VIKEIITREQADILFGIVLILGLILLPVAAVVARGRGKSPLRAALAVGGPPTLVGVLWRVYNAITDRMGLDTVANLLVNLFLFVVVGVACGVGWVMLTRRPPVEEETADTPEAEA
jgi:hypothetical protein